MEKENEECLSEEEACDPVWGQVAELKKTDNKIKHKNIFSMDDCIGKADELGVNAAIWQPNSSKGLCFTYTANKAFEGVSENSDEVILFYGCPQ